jgi:glycosyltransferase 2 family protein
MESATEPRDALLPAPPKAAVKRRRWIALLWRALMLAFFVAVATLIVTRARQVDWARVGESLASYGAVELLLAFVAAALGYACTGSYDLIGRRYTGHGLSAWRTFSINAVAYAFSLNLGALIGGWGFRVRLYTRFGLPVWMVLRIIVLAVVTNWGGFVLLSGLLLLLWPPALPPEWSVPVMALRAAGIALLGIVAAYLGACAIGHRRGWALQVRGQRMRLPSLRMGLAQLVLSIASWLLMAAALALLLPADLSFKRVVESLFASSVAGAALHVPGNVGVLEGSFAALMANDLDEVDALAGVLAFRAVYFLAPLALAGVGYAALEVGARRLGRTKG